MARVDNRQLTDEEIEEVKRLNPVEDVIPEYGIQLRAEGARFKGLCPFHPDANHPNLTVFPDKRRWRCFACQEWGDVIGFVQRKENISFLDAYQRLRARRPGTVSATSGARPTTYLDTSITAVPPPTPKAERPRKPWDRLNLQEQLVMNSAGLVYQDALWHNPQALAYVRERGLPDWTIRQCSLGYADGHPLELLSLIHI